MAEFTVTLACADPLHLAEDIEAASQGGASGLHIDIMDGHYVPNLCMSFDQLEAIRHAYPEMPVDVHLMVTQPFEWLSALYKSRPQRVAFHLDATSFSRRLLCQLQKEKIQAGLVINPSQPLHNLRPMLDQLDYVVLMAVEPGFSGQVMLPDTTERIRRLAEMRKESGRDFSIMVDGGVNFTNGRECAAAGADILVGGALCCFSSRNVQANCRTFAQTL